MQPQKEKKRTGFFTGKARPSTSTTESRDTTYRVKIQAFRIQVSSDSSSPPQLELLGSTTAQIYPNEGLSNGQMDMQVIYFHASPPNRGSSASSQASQKQKEKESLGKAIITVMVSKDVKETKPRLDPLESYQKLIESTEPSTSSIKPAAEIPRSPLDPVSLPNEATRRNESMRKNDREFGHRLARLAETESERWDESLKSQELEVKGSIGSLPREGESLIS